jgi:hypothetical protein
MSEASMAAKQIDASFALKNHAVVVFVSVLMFLPSAVFAVSLRPLPAALVLSGCLGALALIARGTSAEEGDPLDARLDVRRLLLAVALAGVILTLGGAMHLFHPPKDWHIRDAVLADLSLYGFPVVYDFGGTDYLLRAPLGMYMIPAAFGKIFGLFAAHVALWVQNSLFLGSILYMLGTLGRGWPHVFIMLFFCSIALFALMLILSVTGLDSSELEVATGHKFDPWRGYVIPTGSVHQFFWVPNHALPGWWLATLMLLQTRSRGDSATLIASIAGACFWSPLAVLPAALWATFRALTNPWRHIANGRVWVAALAGLCFLPLAVYMVLSAGSISHGVSTAYTHGALDSLCLLVIFLHAIYIFIRRESVPKPLFVLFTFGFLVLLILPIFRFGPTNDLVTRGAIPLLVVMAFAFGWIVLDPKLGRLSFYIGWAFIAAATPSALFELSQSLGRPAYAISDCTLWEASYASGDREPPSNYMVESAKIPPWLMTTEAKTKQFANERQCWTGS